MKIRKLIFENSYQFEHFVQGKGFDFLMKIETTDPTYTKQAVVNLKVLQREHSFSFELLKEILDYFSDIIDNEKIEIDELKLNIHSDHTGFNYIKDIWDTNISFEDEQNYRDSLAKKLHIKNMSILLPQSTKNLLLSHIGLITDNIEISIYPKTSLDSVSVNGGTELTINAGGNKINEIRIGDLVENQKIYLRNIVSDEVQIANLGYPLQNREIAYLELFNSNIENIELRGFSEASISINEAKFGSTLIKGGVIDNITFNKIILGDSRISNTGFVDIIFPKESRNFLLRNCKLEKNTYSNIDWGNYFSEYESSTYKKGEEIVEKKWFISKGGLKETYRMLKHEHDEIGNKTEANKFFAKEMEYHMKSLKLNDWDKIIISFLQRYSNNYGNSWLMPFLWIIIISFGYTFIFNCWGFQCSCGGFQNWYCFSDYWLKNVSQFPTELKNAKDWWFFGYAIIMGSLIYQLLIALRRISQR